VTVTANDAVLVIFPHPPHTSLEFCYAKKRHKLQSGVLNSSIFLLACLYSYLESATPHLLLWCHLPLMTPDVPSLIRCVLSFVFCAKHHKNNWHVTHNETVTPSSLAELQTTFTICCTWTAP